MTYQSDDIVKKSQVKLSDSFSIFKISEHEQLKGQHHNEEIKIIEGFTFRSTGRDPNLTLPLLQSINTGSIILQVKIMSSEATTFQVFYKPFGQSVFLEENSIKQKISKGLTEVYIIIPAPVHDRIRIDPAMHPGVYSILSLELNHLPNE
jgi:hypothetical protein